jgi:integrase
MNAAKGSIRQRGRDSFELRVYGGTDPVSRRFRHQRHSAVVSELRDKRFIRVRRAAGPSHFRLHDLRHFMAAQMLDASVPIPIVAARLCHARAPTTLNVYAHAVPGGAVGGGGSMAEAESSPSLR